MTVAVAAAACRGLEKGDTCLIDTDVKLKGTGSSLPGMKHVKLAFDTEAADPLNFVGAMVGMVQGEERTFPVT